MGRGQPAVAAVIRPVSALRGGSPCSLSSWRCASCLSRFSPSIYPNGEVDRYCSVPPTTGLWPLLVVLFCYAHLSVQMNDKQIKNMNERIQGLQAENSEQSHTIATLQDSLAQLQAQNKFLEDKASSLEKVRDDYDAVIRQNISLQSEASESLLAVWVLPSMYPTVEDGSHRRWNAAFARLPLLPH